MATLEYIIRKFDLNPDDNQPVQLPITRDDLATLFAELGFKGGAEIGVERGLYSETLLRANPHLFLHLIDPLEPYEGYREHVSKEKMDNFYQQTVERLRPYGNHMFHRQFSMDAVKTFKDESLDFVYIDANHDFQNTTNDIAEWSKKVKKGGIIAGHDFTRNKKKDYKCHVKDVVHGWTYAYGIKPWFVTSDRSPSWFYVK